MKRAQWIDHFKQAFSDLGTAVKDMTEKPNARSLSPAQCRKLYDDAEGIILYLLDHPPDNGAPATADVPPPGPPADPAAAHRRQAKRTLIRFFSLCLPSYVSRANADEIESIVDDIVEAAVIEVQRADMAARLEATPTPA